MNWIYLILVGIFEDGWPLGLKLAQTMVLKIFAIRIVISSMSLSGVFLWIDEQTIPIGTACAVWTGIGAVSTLLIGILFCRFFNFLEDVLCSYGRNSIFST